MRLFPIQQSQKPVAREPEIARPLDLTLPPLLGEGEAAPLDHKPLLPPLFGLQPEPGTMSLGGRLITNEQDNTPFEFDLSNMIDRIEGAELRIEIRR